MNNKSTGIIFAVLLSFPFFSYATITNGDFETGDLTGWSTDTDFGPGSAGDFSVSGSPGSYKARIEADYWSTPGDTFSTPLNDVFFGNILYQNLDTTVNSGGQLELSFDWDFGGEDGNAFDGEIFSVGLFDGIDYYKADGTLGFLIDPTTTYNSGTFVATLDSSIFNNVAGWSLDFQLEVGADFTGFSNGLGSFAEIDNVGLTGVSVQVPEPASITLMLIGLLGIIKAIHQKYYSC